MYPFSLKMLDTFDEIEALRANNWKEPERNTEAQSPNKSTASPAKKKLPNPLKPRNGSGNDKQREEARKRLLVRHLNWIWKICILKMHMHKKMHNVLLMWICIHWDSFSLGSENDRMGCQVQFIFNIIVRKCSSDVEEVFYIFLIPFQEAKKAAKQRTETGEVGAVWMRMRFEDIERMSRPRL